MIIKYLTFDVEPDNVESRLNEELKGWQIKKISYLDLSLLPTGNIQVTLVGEQKEWRSI